MSDLPPVLLFWFALVFFQYVAIAVFVYLRRPQAVSGVILSVVAIEAMLINLPGISVGGINLYMPDLVLLPIFLAGLILLFNQGKPSLFSAVILSLIVIWGGALFRGIGEFGIATAGNESRPTFYFFAVVLYFSSQKDLDHDRIVRQWLKTCIAFACIALFRWTASSMHFPMDRQWEIFATAGSSGYLRVLQSTYAMFLAVGMVLSLQLKLRKAGSPWERQMVYLLAPLVLMLQHRTVWIISVVAIAWLILHEREYRAALVTWVSAAGFSAIALFLLLNAGAHGELVSALSSASSDTRTFEWRVEGWRLLLSDRGVSSVGWLFGQPFGTGFEREMYGTIVDVSPHNYYVQALLQLGVVGLFLLIILYVMPFRCRSVSSSRGQQTGGVWKVVLIVQLLYFITYNPTFDQGIVLGAALSSVQLTVDSWRRSTESLKNVDTSVPAFRGSTHYVT